MIYKNRDFTNQLWILFFFWPFLAFLISVFNFKNHSLRKFILLFFVYYGFVFVIKNPEVDANRYVEQLVHWNVRDLDDYVQVLKSMYSTENAEDITDPFVVTIDFLLSRFSTSKQFLFATFALLFGFVYIKSISAIFDYKKEFNSYIVLFYIFYFASILSIININAFRFAFACWIFFFGSYHLITKKGVEGRLTILKWFLIAFFSVFVHFSFIIPCVVLLIYVLIGNRGSVYYPLVAASFVFRQDFSEYFAMQDVDIPASISKKSQAYLSEGYNSLYNTNRANVKWFIKYPYNFIFASIALISLRLRFQISKLEQGTINLFFFCLLYFSFANFVGATNQLIRFQFITSLFVITLIVRAYKDLAIKKYEWLDILAVCAFVLHLSIVFRIGSETFNLLLFGPNFFAILDDSTSLYDIIFQ